jgi:hypothetical protein
MTRATDTTFSGFLSSANAFLLIGAAMLPVSGVIVRLVRFALAGVAPSARLAVSAPIPELAAAGVYPVLVVAALTAAGYIVLRPVDPGVSRSVGGWLLLTAGVISIGIVLIGPIVVGFLVVAILAEQLVLRIRLHRQWHSPPAVANLVALSVLTAILHGAFGRSDPPADFVIDAAGVPSGEYVYAGRTDATLLLLPCGDRGVLFEVPADSVKVVRYDADPPMTVSSLDLGARLREATIGTTYVECH